MIWSMPMLADRGHSGGLLSLVGRPVLWNGAAVRGHGGGSISLTGWPVLWNRVAVTTAKGIPYICGLI